MNASLRQFALWVIIVLLLLALFTLFQNPSPRNSATELSYSQFLAEVDSGRVREVVIRGNEIRWTNIGRSDSFQTHAPFPDPGLITRLYDKSVNIIGRPAAYDDVPWFVSLLMSWLPFLVLIGVWVLLSRQMANSRKNREGGGGKTGSFDV